MGSWLTPKTRPPHVLPRRSWSFYTSKGVSISLAPSGSAETLTTRIKAYLQQFIYSYLQKRSVILGSNTATNQQKNPCPSTVLLECTSLIRCWPSRNCVTALRFIKRLKSKKRSERRKHCALAVVRRSQKCSPSRRPPSWGVGRPEFNQLEMVTTFTYRLNSVRIDARNFELLW